MNAVVNRQWRLASRPVGMVTPGHFTRAEQPVPTPGANELLVRTFQMAAPSRSGLNPHAIMRHERWSRGRRRCPASSEEAAMRSSKWWGALLMSSLSFSLTAGLAQDQQDNEVLVNRSFETGPDPGQLTVLSPGNTDMKGWTVVGGSVSYVGGKWKPAQGVRSVGLGCGGGISQTFATTPKQKYEVRFSMAGDPNSRPALKSVEVSFGEVTRTFTFDTTGRSFDQMGWDPRSWVFTAPEGTGKTTLTIRSPKAQCSTPAVDNVRVISLDSAV
jgi:choice-of-anchor C domain-containing protein